MDIEPEMVEEAPTSSGNFLKTCYLLITYALLALHDEMLMFTFANIFSYMKLVKSRKVLHCNLIQVMIIVQTDDLRDALNF